MFKIKKSILFLGIITFVASFFIFARFSPVARAQDAGPQVWGGQGGSEYMAETGLQTQDIRITIAKVIRVILGFLGIIALIIIIYAGYLWMMAGGNADQIETAKKWMRNAVIGLIIVLSSFAIASFVLSKLTGVTGSGDGYGGDGGNDSPLPVYYSCIDPAVSASSCATDACRVNAALLSATPYVCGIYPTKAVIGAYVTIAGYHFNIYDSGKSKVEFYSANATKIAEIVVCPGNNSYNWTDNRIVVKVPELSAGIYSIKVTNKDGNVNGVANQKVFQVLEGNKIPPGIACILPDEGKENSAVEIFGDYFGDVKSSSEVVFADDVSAAIKDAESWSMKKITASVPFGAISGNVIVKTIEVSGNDIIEAQSNGYPFKVVCALSNECASGCCYNSSFCANVNYCVGQSCDNNKATSLCEAGNCGAKLVCDTKSCACKSPGEGDPCDNDLTAEGCQAGICAEGLTCAQDCVCKKLPGPGEACADGAVNNCAQGQCNSLSICDESSCLCEARPVINEILPDNGASGNLITIGGVNFGNEKGTIFFVSKADSKEISARLAGEVNKDCSYNDWTDTKIIVEIPSGIGLGDYEVKVVASKTGLSDKKGFKVNNIIRPGLCAVYKGTEKIDSGKYEDAINLAGVNLGDIDKVNEITFGNENAGRNPIDKQLTNNNLLIQGIGIPNLLPDLTTIFVKDENNGNASNPVNFTILESLATPKITDFLPKAGHQGDYVTIYGRGFGTVRREVKFGDATGDFLFPQECLSAVWKDDQIIVKVPAGIASGEYSIKVKINDNDELTSSEKFYVGDYCSKDFKICPEPAAAEALAGKEGEDGCEKAGRGKCIKIVSPGLCKINPVKGPAKTPVTFFGENFGVLEADGKKSNALFNYKAGEKSVAPSAWINGGNGTNKADQATANVPDEPRSGDIKIKSALGLESNGLHFDAGSCVGENGQADNDKCPASSSICCGANSYFEGACVASASDCGSSIKDPTEYVWTFTTQAPDTIPNCKDITGGQSGCEGNSFCCWTEEGICSNSCPVSRLLQVKEQCYTGIDCAANAVGPSPSPWKEWPNGDSACVDAVVRAEFSAEIEQDTLNKSNITVFECVENSCANAVAGKIKPAATGFSFTADENLKKNTWYQVALKGTNGIKSFAKDGKSGKFLDGDKDGKPGGDYVWKFKTRDDASPCEIGCPIVSPDKYTARNKNKIKYEGAFTAKNNQCVILSGASKEWAWSSNSSKAAISSSRDCCAGCNSSAANWACIEPLEETNGEKINITGNVKVDDKSKSSYGELEIKFADFKVEEISPPAGCDAVCLNAAVAAKFSGEVDMTTVAGNFLIEGEEGVKGKEGEEGSNNREIVFKGLSLKVNADYRVIIKGGAAGIRNVSGGGLTGLNYDSDGDKINDSFSWTFKTADKECAVNSVAVDPSEAYVENIGDSVKYWADPFSTPDKCSQIGQRLNAQSYNWLWSKGDTNSGIAKISSADQGKPYNSVTAIDGPTAPKNQATVKINAVEEKSGKIGSGDFTIICGYKYGNAAHDAACGDGKAVAENGCCYDRPGIVEIQPATTNNVINNFCLNGVVKIKFNQLMDESALKNALILKEYSADGQCSQSLGMAKVKSAVAGAMAVRQAKSIWKIIDGKFMFMPKFLISAFISPSININNYFSEGMTLRGAMAFRYGLDKMLVLAKGLFNTAGAAEGWCGIGQKVIPVATVWNGKKVTEITIIPDDLLTAHNASLTYDYQLNFSGLKSRQGIFLIHNPVNITTGAEICRIDHVDVVINNTSEGESITKDIFTCAGRNTCGENTEIVKDNDANAAVAGNQHLYDASAIDAHNNPLNAQKYVWLENDLNVSANFPDGAVKLSQVSDSNGNQIENQRWVTANPITSVDASFEIGAYYGNMNDGYYSKASTTIDVTLFMCENPWPSLAQFPYEDTDYNFSTYVCLDSGDVNDQTDDLPSLGNQTPSGQIYICKDGTIKAGLRCAGDAACAGVAGACVNKKCVGATPNAGNSCDKDQDCGVPAGSCELKILKEYLWVEEGKN